MKEENTCENCPAFCEDKDNKYSGYCRAELPKVGLNGMATWVKVSRVYWCMHHPQRKWEIKE